MGCLFQKKWEWEDVQEGLDTLSEKGRLRVYFTIELRGDANRLATLLFGNGLSMSDVSICVQWPDVDEFPITVYTEYTDVAYKIIKILRKTSDVIEIDEVIVQKASYGDSKWNKK